MPAMPITQPRRSPLCCAIVCVLALVLLVPCSGASGQGAHRLSAGGASAVFDPGDDYLPSQVLFNIGNERVSVSVSRVGLVGKTRPATAGCKVTRDGDLHAARSMLTWPDGAGCELTTVAHEGRAAVSFRLTGNGPARQLVLHVAGAHRFIRKGPTGFAVASLNGDGMHTVAGSTIILQSRTDQHGLAITGKRMTVTAAPDGAIVRISLPPPGEANAPATVEVRAFRGDALIAYEETVQQLGGDASATPITAVALQEPTAQAVPAPAAGQGAASRPPTQWHWLTGTDRTFKPLLADPREAQVRVGFMYHDGGEKYLEAGIGGDLVIAKGPAFGGDELSFSLRGAIIGRLNTCESSFPLLNTDFYVGAAAGYRRGADSFELFLFHQSSHLGDEILEAGERMRIDYSREAIRILWAHDFEDVGPGRLRIYAGPTVNFRGFPRDIRCRPIFQFGAEYRWTAWGTPMYLACDAQSKTENNWDMNVTAQFGVELGDPSRVKSLPRAFVEFYNGFSNMGQYFDVHETYVMVGVGYNF